MIKKNSVSQTGSILMLIFVLMFSSECHAFFYRPAAAVSILSEYSAFNDSAPPHTQFWRVVPESAPDDAVTLRFFSEAVAKADAVCELELPPFGSVGEIRWKGIGKRGEKRSNTGLLLAPGFPAPCDVLPVDEKDEGRVYKEKSEAGGSVFIKSYRVSSAPFSVAEAKAKGWVRGEKTHGIAGLIMVTVTDEKGQLAVRQLWPADGSWWLYEETPVRRSWLIY